MKSENTLDNLMKGRKNLLEDSKLKCKWGIRKYCPKFIGVLISESRLGPLWEACGLICIPKQQLTETKRMRKAVEKLIELLEEMVVE